MNSMAKWFFQETEDEPLYEISVQEEITARLHFIKFENAYIETCLDFVKDHLVNTETKVIKATGGGAHKFKDLLEKKLKLKATRNASEMNSMAKWFFQETEDEPLYEISVQEEITARLHFIKFENAYIETCLDFVKDHLVNTETKVIKATGGGAHKFKDLLEKKLKLKVDKEDEMSCLIKGCNFVLKNIPHEAFVYVKHAEPEFRFQTTHPDIFPYLLINIGSGVSIVKVESEDKFERIGGSSIGGGTFWGLGALLTKTKRFDELLQLASRGQHTSVDMLVKDIYGGAYGSLGLTGDLIASSFGKSATADKEFSKEDMAKSLLHMISNDIGQLACLYAKLHNLSRVYFGGFFIRGHPVTMHTITYSIHFFTKGEVQALFLRHEGYLGAIGAFLKGAEEDNPNQYSWGENYAGSSGLMSVSPDMFPMQRTRSGTVRANAGHANKYLCVCYLRPVTY
ncbi:UNVERIFIED_CONTAM: hypothetical protein FKN15_036550 [Acipenser sinensis]